jgi:hypothetical protein
MYRTGVSVARYIQAVLKMHIKTDQYNVFLVKVFLFLKYTYSIRIQ